MSGGLDKTTAAVAANNYNLAWNTDDRPWFITFNPYYGPSTTLTFYWFEPFPEDEFVTNSPYDEHVVIAHHGIERFAEAAGQPSVEGYIKGLIVAAVTRQLEKEPA
jgi:hypothetical protein